MEGWIKLHRKILQSDMYRSLNSKQRDVVTVILLMANHKEKQWEHKGEIYKAKPGQFVTSLESIKKNCAKDVSIQNIRTALLKLEKWGFLTSKSTNKNRLITVVNWEVYQPQEKNQQADQHSTNKQLTTNKNVENVEKKDNDQPSSRSKNSYSDDFEEFWSIYPKKVGKQKAFTHWKARIKKESKDNLIKAVQNYTKYCEVEGTIQKFIKHPSTFLSTNLDYKDWIEYKPEQPKSNVTPFPGKQKPEPIRVNTPSSIEAQRQLSVEEQMRKVKEERMRKRKEAELNGTGTSI